MIPSVVCVLPKVCVDLILVHFYYSFDLKIRCELCGIECKQYLRPVRRGFPVGL